MAAAAQAQAKAQPVSGISRREFLYYVWGASIALYLAEFTGLILWFAIPRIKEGEFGGVFRLTPEEVVPGVNNVPYDNPDGRFWLVNVDTTDIGLTNDLMYMATDEDAMSGVLALYKVCTHLGCIYSWNAANNRFQCPCHGSKYRLDGRRIESPAPRSTDRFKITFVDADGTVLSESEPDEVTGYAPVEMPVGAVEILVDTGDLADGGQLDTLDQVEIIESP